MLYAIRSERYGYRYAGKPESPMFYLSWYAVPLDATHYKNKQSAQRRAKYYQSLGIECKVIEIREDFDACGYHRFKDVELENRHKVLIEYYGNK